MDGETISRAVSMRLDLYTTYLHIELAFAKIIVAIFIRYNCLEWIEHLISSEVEDIKKIEIIARITEESGNTIENSLMAWQDYGQWHEYPLTSSVLSYPGLEIRLHQRRVLRDGEDITLSKYEYGVLVFLAQHPGWLCSKEQIFQNVWHEDSESSLTAIANTISRIRQKIEPDKDHPIYIQTVSNLGYVFAAKPL